MSFGSPKRPAPPPLPPPVEPAPEPQEFQAEDSKTRQATRKRLAASDGRRSTILTTGLGLTEGPATAPKTVLGA